MIHPRRSRSPHHARRRRRPDLGINRSDTDAYVQNGMRRMTLRNRVIFVTTLALSACERPVAYDPGPVPSRHTVEKYVSHELGIDSFVKTYWPYEPNKAFAVSDDGVYGYSASRLSSPEFAERS